LERRFHNEPSQGGPAVGKHERHYKIKHQLDAGRCLTLAELTDSLQASPATIKRDIRDLRHRMNAPVAWCPDRHGWYLDRSQQLAGAQYELPGLWLSAAEIHALLTMQHLLANLDSGGLLGPLIAPLTQRLAKALDGDMPANAEVARRIRVQTVGARRLHLPHFQSLGSALLRRKRVVIAYHGRSTDRDSQREVSPQRLVHYRDNWYLDAWCHWRNALRSFSLDAVQAVNVLHRAAIDIPDAELDQALGAGYGIFAGRTVQWATLRFSAAQARWVAAERWHADQLGRWDSEGRWLLTLPYADPRELVMDILRHVPEVEVIGPEELRDEVARRMRQGLDRLAGPNAG
jgi:predicted DNA-binding transcriptional regulator YafY